MQLQTEFRAPPALSTTLATSSGAPRIAALDTLRGVACLWVVALHALDLSSLGSGTLLSVLAEAIISIGFLGVNLFLVLSGFCLYYAVLSRGRASVPYGPFMARRFTRIMPPHYAALAICLFLCRFPLFSALGPPRHAWDPLLHVLMLNNLSPVTVNSINPVFWSLALEWQLYLIFPCFLWLMRRGGLAALLGTTLVISLMAQCAALVILKRPHTWGLEHVLYWSLPSRCFEFACGMAAAHFVVHRSVPRLTLSVVIACAAWICFRYPGVSPAGRQFTVNVYAVSGVMFGGLVALCASHRGVLWDVGIGRALGMIGVFSYSIYLTHSPVLLALDPLMDRWSPRPMIALICNVAACVVVGWLFYLAVERHFLTRRAARPAKFKRGAISAGALPV